MIASASPAPASASNGGPVSCRLPDEPGLGARRHQLLGALKRDGPSRVAELAKRAGVNVETVLREAFDSYVAMRRGAAMERLHGLLGPERVEAAAGILTEMGFMAEVQEDGTSLRLCHSPYRQLVEVSSIPCRAEVSLVAELLGEGSARTKYIPDGHAACSHRLDLPARPEVPADGKVDQ